MIMSEKALKLIGRAPSGKVTKLNASCFPEGKRFNFMFQEGWDALSQLRLSPTETAVFFRLMARLGFANWVPVSQETLAEELGVKRPNVTAAIKRLVELNVIQRQRDPIDKRRWMYRVNTYLGWKGNPGEWNTEEQAGKVVPLYPAAKH